jgi:sentrin-specific protease 1
MYRYKPWEMCTDEKTPKQKNGWDCGVFTCITAERLLSPSGKMDFGQDHMDRLREYMAAEIIDGVFYH